MSSGEGMSAWSSYCSYSCSKIIKVVVNQIDATVVKQIVVGEI
jgi:hypothetical protein